MAHPSKARLLSDPSLRRLLRKVLRHRRMLALSVAAMAVTAGIDAATAQLTGLLTDRGFVERDLGAAGWVLAGLVGVVAVRGLSQFTTGYVLNRISQEVLVELRTSMFDRMLHWPAATFEKTPSSSVISKFLNEATNALNLAAEVITTLVRDTLSVIVLLSFLIYKNWQLTLVMLVVGPLVGLILRAFSGRLRRLNVENQRLLGEMTQAVQEGFDGQRVIKVYDGAQYEHERFAGINARLRGYAMRMQVAWSGATPVTQVVTMSGIAVLIYAGLVQAKQTGQTAGDFVTFINAALLLLPPLRHLAALNGPVARLVAAAESVYGMIDTPPEEDRGTRHIERAAGRVEFRGVTFRYPGAAADALRDFDLDVRPGEMIALVGPSGAGKTTVINLLPRFIEPSGGAILLDGIPLPELTLSSLRRQMALVSQEVVLFDDTVAANIAYGGSRGAPLERIRAAAEAANLLSFIEALPGGFDARIGENAVRLSGGQRQRLSIARALLKDAPILLLDEATSALDSDSERAIQASLERLMQGRTTFVVAHRLSTIERADRIVVLEHGRIAEIGTHAELLARGGLYAHLHGIQFSAIDQGSPS